MLRESFFLLFSVLFFYRLIILYSKKSRTYNEHLIIIILLLLATLIRPQVFPIFILIYMISLIYYQRGLKKIVSVSLFLLSIVIISYSNLTLFQFVDSNLLNLYYFQLYRNAFSDLPNAYLVNIAYRDWWDFISYFPSFITHFLLLSQTLHTILIRLVFNLEHNIMSLSLDFPHAKQKCFSNQF